MFRLPSDAGNRLLYTSACGAHLKIENFDCNGGAFVY